MNTHAKIIEGAPVDLSRRSFLVGSAAVGLALGYSAVPGLLGADQALAAASNFDPSVWYSIAPDGIVTVTCGKADMGQHIASTMAQIICEELGANWRDMRVQLASNDPKYNDPVLGAQITGGSWSTMMNFDAMSRAGAAGRIALTEAAAAAMGAPAGDLVVRDSTITNPKSKKSMTFAEIVKSGKATKTFTPDELACRHAHRTCRGFAQRDTPGGARPAHRVEVHHRRPAAAGDLGPQHGVVELRIVGRKQNPHVFPVGTELLADDLRHGGGDVLAHVGLATGHRDDAVGSDRVPDARLEIARCCGQCTVRARYRRIAEHQTGCRGADQERAAAQIGGLDFGDFHVAIHVGLRSVAALEAVRMSEAARRIAFWIRE